jgi:CxxC motif-containing protein
MRNITCTVCPMGCSLVVSKVDGEYKVEGNTCKRGAKYGVEEVTNPRRVITTTVKLNGGYLNLLPVKTNDSVPKELMFDIMKLLDKVLVNAPVSVGDVIIKDILGTGVDVVSAKSMDSLDLNDGCHHHELKHCI